MRLFLAGHLAATLCLPAAAQVCTPPPAPRAYVVAVIGQSNAQGPGNKLLSPLVGPKGLAWNASANGATGSWAPANDPQSPTKISSMQSQTGSFVPSLVNTLLADSARVSDVRITHYAMSGTHLLPRGGETAANHWGPGGQLRAGADKQIGLMLATAACPDKVDAIVIDLGPSDGYRLALNATTLAPFPHGYVVDSAAHAVSGEIISYPAGYSNPNGLPNQLDALKEFYLHFLTKYPGVRIVVNLTATWTPSTGGISHQRGCRQMRWIQLRAIKDLREQGCNIVANRLPLSFAACGWVNPDGVHYLQPGLNALGAADARFILTP